MLLSRSRLFILPRIAAPLLGGLLLAAAFQNGARAEALAPSATNVYVISGAEGYGVVECLTEKKDCGKIVADSWCEAHGHGLAKAFGRADDMTASIGPTPARLAEASSAIVACGE
jgi:hypothetical protein